MSSCHVICDFSSLLILDVVQFARILLTMVKHMIFREYVDDHPRAGWSDHMDGLPCDRGRGQAAHSRQGWCYWHLRGGPFQELDQPEITICRAGVPQRHQRASRSRDWGRVGHREAYVPEVTMIISMLIFFRSWQQLWWCRWWFLWRFARLGAIVVTWDINTVSEQ